MMNCVLSVSVEMWLYHPLVSAPQSWGSCPSDSPVPWASAHLFHTFIYTNLRVQPENPSSHCLHLDVSAIVIFPSVFNLLPKDAFMFTCNFGDKSTMTRGRDIPCLTFSI